MGQIKLDALVPTNFGEQSDAEGAPHMGSTRRPPYDPPSGLFEQQWHTWLWRAQVCNSPTALAQMLKRMSCARLLSLCSDGAGEPRASVRFCGGGDTQCLAPGWSRRLQVAAS